MTKRPPASGRFYFILNVLIVIMYACGGIILFFWKIPSLPDWNRQMLSGIIILYSIYRGFVLYRKNKNTTDES